MSSLAVAPTAASMWLFSTEQWSSRSNGTRSTQPTVSARFNNFCNLTLHRSNMSNVGNLLQGVALDTNILLGEFIKFDHHGNEEMLSNMTLNPDFPGLMARLMDEICSRAGCSWRNTYSILGALPPNRTYSELIIWSTETYDISVDWWMRSTERMLHGAAFIEPWYVQFCLFSVFFCAFYSFFPTSSSPTSFYVTLLVLLFASLSYYSSTGMTHPSSWSPSRMQIPSRRNDSMPFLGYHRLITMFGS